MGTAVLELVGTYNILLFWGGICGLWRPLPGWLRRSELLEGGMGYPNPIPNPTWYSRTLGKIQHCHTYYVDIHRNICRHIPRHIDTNVHTCIATFVKKHNTQIQTFIYMQHVCMHAHLSSET